MHPCDECIRRGILYQVSEESDKCAFCLEYGNESCSLIVTDADWRRINKQKKKMRRKLREQRLRVEEQRRRILEKNRKTMAEESRLARLEDELQNVKATSRKIFDRKLFNIAALKKTSGESVVPLPSTPPRPFLLPFSSLWILGYWAF